MALFGGGDDTRIIGTSRLAARRWDFVDPPGIILLGIAGTGGASIALGTGCDGDGEGSRKVRSDIDPELPFRFKAGPGCPRDKPATEEPPLPIEDIEPYLRSIRLVWTSATDVGVVGRARRAAAAAAEDSALFDAWFFKKAWAAAVAAEGSAFSPLRCCAQRC